jgi:acyl-CoA thioesterase FadM
MRVTPVELDLLQHMNQAQYVRLFERARYEAAVAHGRVDHDAAWSLPQLRFSVEYIREVKLGDQIEVFETDPSASTQFLEMRRQGHAVARARVSELEVLAVRDRSPVKDSERIKASL